jgi:DNA-binding NarL/FixJ family response regulator
MLPSVIRVAVIEDIREVREGLTRLFAGSDGFSSAGGFRTMEEALDRLDPSRLDVILTDIGLPGMDGVAGTRALRERFPSIPVVALTVYDDDDNVFSAICAGASGYLLKNTAPDRLLESVREVAAGGAPMSPEIARRVLTVFRQFRPAPRAASGSSGLTPQETALLKLMVDGHHYKTAAAELGITSSTVSFHLKNIYQKLQVHSKTEAVAKALRERLI